VFGVVRVTPERAAKSTVIALHPFVLVCY